MNVNLEGSWSQLWGRISGVAPGLFTLLAMIGVGLLVFALATFIWKKRSGGANPQSLMWSAAIGALLSAPSIIIPMLLKLIDLVINLVLGVIKV